MAPIGGAVETSSAKVWRKAHEPATIHALHLLPWPAAPAPSRVLQVIGCCLMRLRVPCAVLLTLLLARAAQAQQPRKFTFAYDQPKTTAYGIAANIFDAKLKELSGGTMSINQFPGAQLGQEPQMLQKMRAGDIDFVITSTANASDRKSVV